MAISIIRVVQHRANSFITVIRSCIIDENSTPNLQKFNLIEHPSLLESIINFVQNYKILHRGESIH